MIEMIVAMAALVVCNVLLLILVIFLARRVAARWTVERETLASRDTWIGELVTHFMKLQADQQVRIATAMGERVADKLGTVIRTEVSKVIESAGTPPLKGQG